MIAIDTNVLVRWALRDDEAQFLVAERLLEQPCWVGWTVWLEFGWVLMSVAGLSRSAMADVLEAVCAIETLHFDRPERLHWAIARFREAGDYADLIHLAACADHSRFVSFEKRLARQAGGLCPIPVEFAK